MDIPGPRTTHNLHTLMTSPNLHICMTAPTLHIPVIAPNLYILVSVPNLHKSELLWIRAEHLIYIFL